MRPCWRVQSTTRRMTSSRLVSKAVVTVSVDLEPTGASPFETGGRHGCAARHPQQRSFQHDSRLRLSGSIVLDLKFAQIRQKQEIRRQGLAGRRYYREPPRVLK